MRFVGASSVPEVFYIGHTPRQHGLLPPHLLDLQFEYPDVLQPLCVLGLSLVQCGLVDPDLLMKQCQFVIPANELSAKDVPFIDHLGRWKEITHLKY